MPNTEQGKLLDFFLGNRAEMQGFLMKRLRSAEDTDDILQEIYLRIEKFTGEEDIMNSRAFVYRIANNLAIDRMRQRTRHRNHHSDGEDTCAEIAAPLPPADQIIYDRSRLKFLQEALGKLSEKQRACFILHRCDKMTYKEVGQKVGLSESMAKKHVIKALAHCRKYMRKIEG
ncbi:RNA polymerase sigma factor [Paremcibacter congregatus]|uniref:RNA polymerase sigma factor n=1 Tax=Paremcibacter congregatus TaxID=2043170 RepID=UPI003A90855A